MSRIGRREIIIPEGVEIHLDGNTLEAKKNEQRLSLEVPSEIQVNLDNRRILVTRDNDLKSAKSKHGLVRTLIANMIQGLTEGYEKKLEIIGVGYRASVEENKLILKVGFSHDITLAIAENLSVEVKKNVITVCGADKQLVGQFAAQIRAVKKPEPYKGKGIRYQGERVLKKVGKAAKGVEK